MCLQRRFLGRYLLAVSALCIFALACAGDGDDTPTAVPTPNGIADSSPAPTDSSPAPTEAANSSPSVASDINGDGIISLREQNATAQTVEVNRSLSEPARDTLFSCTASAMGEPLGQPWVDVNGVVYFADKPAVEGLVSWDSIIAITEGADGREISGNALPDHPTGEFPIDVNSEAWQYDRNPNSISEGDISYVVPTNPTIADEPGCLPLGPIGVALTGAVFFNALDADNRDAVANEVFDVCEGHPDAQGGYHYHHGTPCIEDGDENEHSSLVGYALDGLGIYGPRDSGGVLLTNDDLDECHGHVGPVPSGDQGTMEVYHYHTNEEFPYTLGCFRGAVELTAGPTRP